MAGDQGMGEEGLKILRDTGDKHGMPVVTEVMDPRRVELVERYADMFQIGARNMQNFDLLNEVGQTRKPVLLKRGMSATVKDLLMSAEYILSEGNSSVVLCERGVRSFESSTRNMLDVAAVPNVKGLSHLPIIVDPSHATGRPDLIPPMAWPASPPAPTASTSKSTTVPKKPSPTARSAFCPINMPAGRADLCVGGAAGQARVAGALGKSGLAIALTSPRTAAFGACRSRDRHKS